MVLLIVLLRVWSVECRIMREMDGILRFGVAVCGRALHGARGASFPKRFRLPGLDGCLVGYGISEQRLGCRECSQIDAVPAAAGEFLVEDVGEIVGIGREQMACSAAIAPVHGEGEVGGLRRMLGEDVEGVRFE